MVLVPISASDKVYIGKPCIGLQVIHRKCSNSSSHKSRDFSVKLGLRTSHRWCGVTHLLASKTSYSAYVSHDVSKNDHLTKIKFSHKTCQIGKIRFRNYFYKNLNLFIVSQINPSCQFYQNNLNFKIMI